MWAAGRPCRAPAAPRRAGGQCRWAVAAPLWRCRVAAAASRANSAPREDLLAFWRGHGLTDADATRLVDAPRPTQNRNLSAYSDLEKLEERLAALQAALPSANVARMVARQPELLVRRGDTLARNVRSMREALPGVDVDRVLEKSPWLANRGPETIERNLAALRELLPGVDADTMVRRCPALLGYDPATLAAKVQSLRDLLPGANIAAVLRAAPQMLNLSAESRERRLRFVSELLPGTSPVRTVERAPQILVYREETLVANMEAMQELLPGVDVVGLVAAMPPLVLSKPASLARKLASCHAVARRRREWDEQLSSYSLPAIKCVLTKSDKQYLRLGVVADVVEAEVAEGRDTELPALTTVLYLSAAKFEDKWVTVWRSLPEEMRTAVYPRAPASPLPPPREEWG